MMFNLRILIISCDVCLPCGFNSLPSSLKIIKWEKYPLKWLPLGSQLNELSQLEMCWSKIIQPWCAAQMPKKLKFINLSYSKDLIQSPDFSTLPNLERLVLEGCIKLVKVHPSLGQHKKVVMVNLTDCINLKSLPNRLDMDSLEKLTLSGCSKLKKLPEFGENMKYFSMLDLKDCKTLGRLPCSIGNLKSLVTLNIFGCSKLLSLPDNLGENESIEELDIRGTAIKEIPSSINSLEDLRKLYANGCMWSALGSSPNLLSQILKVFRLTSYEAPMSLKLPPSISGLSSLKELKLKNCNLNSRIVPNDLG
ncbi:disease resistance protein RUN1-like [Prosopis cineraria]|uniref:disease resistance protein RUN1-like n=1 Tax=Prosopis cineraria TaxID=364024 RepID=UPI00240EFBF0|nr:disease resistance protein RUN1-like [Prosopis cineraria]